MTLQQLLGIDWPLIQAPMAGVQGHALAVAVSNAGALGSLPCAMLGPEALRSEVQALRAGTGRPFNLNFFCHATPLPDAQAEAAWRAALAPYAVELGLDPLAAAGRRVARTLRRGDRRAGGGVQARGGQLPFRLAGGAAAGARARHRRAHPVLGHHRRRGAVAAGPGCRRRHRAGPGGRRPPRLVPVVRPEPAAGPVRVAAAGGACGAAAGHRRGWHRRRLGRGRGAGAGCGRRAGGYCLLAVPGGQHQRAAPCGAAGRGCTSHRADQPVHRAAGARHRQPRDARAGPAARCRAGLPAGGRGDGAAARRSRSTRQQRLHAAVVGPERQRLQAAGRGRADAATDPGLSRTTRA